MQATKEFQIHRQESPLQIYYPVCCREFQTKWNRQGPSEIVCGSKTTTHLQTSCEACKELCSENQIFSARRVAHKTKITYYIACWILKKALRLKDYKATKTEALTVPQNQQRVQICSKHWKILFRGVANSLHLLNTSKILPLATTKDFGLHWLQTIQEYYLVEVCNHYQHKKAETCGQSLLSRVSFEALALVCCS